MEKIISLNKEADAGCKILDEAIYELVNREEFECTLFAPCAIDLRE